MGRNVVVLCDGTGNQYGLQYRNTNVVRLRTLIVEDPDRQVAYYNAGVGTMAPADRHSGAGRVSAIVAGLAFGYGFTENVEDAYRFLMQSWRGPEDDVYLFGFSRGAYTVRALAGMLHAVGLLPPGQENLIRYATRLYRSRDTSVAAQFFRTFSRNCRVRFVGVWDTVAALGVVPGFRREFPDTLLNPDIGIGRQALSIDEKRAAFLPSLWSARYPGQDIRQVWFAGVHSDVGGGYPERDLANAPLNWMIDDAVGAGLLLDVTDVRRYYPDEPLGLIHESLTTTWKLAGKAIRAIPDEALVHWTVRERIAADIGYAPANLPGAFTYVDR